MFQKKPCSYCGHVRWIIRIYYRSSTNGGDSQLHKPFGWLCLRCKNMDVEPHLPAKVRFLSDRRKI